MNYNIDLEQIANKLDFELEDVKMLMEVFLETTDELMDELQKAIYENDLKKIYTLSHTIKGSSSNLTLVNISSLAAEIEQKSRAKKDINYRDKFEDLKRLIVNISF